MRGVGEATRPALQQVDHSRAVQSMRVSAALKSARRSFDRLLARTAQLSERRGEPGEERGQCEWERTTEGDERVSCALSVRGVLLFALALCSLLCSCDSLARADLAALVFFVFLNTDDGMRNGLSTSKIMQHAACDKDISDIARDLGGAALRCLPSSVPASFSDHPRSRSMHPRVSSLCRHVGPPDFFESLVSGGEEESREHW